MFQITDEKTVRSVVRQNGIDRYFETPDIRFRLFHFHKGEYLASPDLRSEYIQFITKGEISIFHIGEDGTITEEAKEQVNALLKRSFRPEISRK